VAFYDEDFLRVLTTIPILHHWNACFGSLKLQVVVPPFTNPGGFSGVMTSLLLDPLDCLGYCPEDFNTNDEQIGSNAVGVVKAHSFGF
jgi:hypothetical protein